MKRVFPWKKMFCAGMIWAALGANAADPKPVPASATVSAAKSQELARKAVVSGVGYLLKTQKENGSWLDDPAITALDMMALIGSRLDTAKPAIEKARAYVLSCANADGSFSNAKKQYLNYTTAVCLSALATLNRKEDHAVMRKARNYLIGSQLSESNPDNPTPKDSPFYGGIGYGKEGPTRPDLSNTQWALEALYLTESLDAEVNGGTAEARKQSELAWGRAIEFLKNVQNMPKDADKNWIVSSDKPEHDGGFVYMPGSSKASEKMNRETLQSYGSMTYAGLKSMIYAKLKKDDFRVKAAVAWGAKHYTLDENPGMGAEGHLYYLHTFAKAFQVFGEEFVESPDGKTHFWRTDLITKLVALQRPDGSWSNGTGRWMESIPELASAYALLCLELALEPSE